jgi:hypothetical protein|uniref:Uncharacterized protein n=1 Tax=Populus trichocarpa TaxID=3694 RepID=B9HFQ3_POPTR
MAGLVAKKTTIGGASTTGTTICAVKCEHSQLTTSWQGSRQGLLSRHAHPLKQGGEAVPTAKQQPRTLGGVVQGLLPLFVTRSSG